MNSLLGSDDMEEFLCERRSTLSYKDGKIFRKYYKYCGEDEVIAEQRFSNEALNSGINCPKFLSWGYCDEKKMFYSEFEFVDIYSINRDTVDTSILKIALKQLDKMPLCDQLNNCVNEHLKKDLFSIIPFLPSAEKNEYIQLINELFTKSSEVFIHGDYSFENIGWDVRKNTVIIFDFQNSGYGVKDWDKSYLLSSVPDIELAFSISDININLMKIITALKYGRGVRKNFEVEERKKIYEYWWK